MDDFCAIGTSRGGVMAYMAARQDQRIKRIVAAFAVSDVTQLYEERDDTKEMLQQYIGCTPEENPSEYERRSAVCWADEIKVPTMIIHSKGDPRVPYDQAERMYRLLKDHTDCLFVSYDDDLHDFHDEDMQKINEWLHT